MSPGRDVSVCGVCPCLRRGSVGLPQENLDLLSRAADELPDGLGARIVEYFRLAGDLTECMRVVQHAYVHHFFQKVCGLQLLSRVHKSPPA